MKTKNHQAGHHLRDGNRQTPDVEQDSILGESSCLGPRSAGYTIVRLPNAVKGLFTDWLRRELPDRASTILNRIRDVRKGKLMCSDFGKRLNGEGQIAEAIGQLFHASCTRYRLNEAKISLSTEHFHKSAATQMEIL